MTPEHIHYMESIGTTKVARDRAESMWGVVSTIAPANLTYVFVCDEINDEGVRSYSSLWFFTDRYIAECKNFIETSNFDYTPNHTRFLWLDITSSNYDFNEHSDSSRVQVIGRIGSSIASTFRATRNNCSYLRDLTKQVLAPMTIDKLH